MRKYSGGSAAALLLCALGFFWVAGCDRPEVERSELGTIVGELPDLPDRPKRLSIPKEADPDCPFVVHSDEPQKAQETPEEPAK